MHKTKCACFTGPNRIPNRNHSLAFNISSTLILEWKFVKEEEGKIENISPFWHSSWPIVRFIQVCSELFMLCHTFVYIVLYFARRPLIISNSKKSPTVLPRWALTHTCVLTTLSAWRSFSYLSVFTALEHSAFALWQICHQVLTFDSNEFHWKVA